MGAEGMQRILRGFGSAEEMFEAGRDAAAALDRSAALDAYLRRRGAGLPTFEAYQRRRPDVMRQRREVVDLVALACHGAALLLGDPRYEDVLFLRFACAEKWRQVAREVGMSLTWCSAAAEKACAAIDALGLERFFVLYCGQEQIMQQRP